MRDRKEERKREKGKRKERGEHGETVTLEIHLMHGGPPDAHNIAIKANADA